MKMARPRLHAVQRIVTCGNICCDSIVSVSRSLARQQYDVHSGVSVSSFISCGPSVCFVTFSAFHSFSMLSSTHS